MTYEVAIIPGDGIGPAVIHAVEPLFNDLAAEYDFEFTTTEYDWGTERYLDTGVMMPKDGVDQLEGYDSILLGAVGHPDVRDHITLHGLLLPIRKRFDQAVCKRPAVLFDGIESPLRGYSSGDIDFVVYRENTEGEYSDVGGRVHNGLNSEVAVQSTVFTRHGTERIVRAAFEAAQEREGHLTSVTKSNAQAYSMVLWDEVVEDLKPEYPDVKVERILVDAASMDLIRRPEEFDVVVASNLFGDILTDIGAIITGSMGIAPSANINLSGSYPSMFEPVHGSAPDIVGKGIANPLATVLSGAMMFDHLGENNAAKTLQKIVADQLSDIDSPRTPDLGGDSGTEDIVADLRNRLNAH